MRIERQGHGGHVELFGGGDEPAHDRGVPEVDAIEVADGDGRSGQRRCARGGTEDERSGEQHGGERGDAGEENSVAAV